MPADGWAVRTGCENGAPRCSDTHRHTRLHTCEHTRGAVERCLCANSQAGSTPTLLSDRLIIVTRVGAVGRRRPLVTKLFCR